MVLYIYITGLDLCCFTGESICSDLRGDWSQAGAGLYGWMIKNEED